MWLEPWDIFILPSYIKGTEGRVWTKMLQLTVAEECPEKVPFQMMAVFILLGMGSHHQDRR